MNDVGYIASAFIICYLVTLSWHAVFWVYILAIPVFFMFEHFIKVPSGILGKAFSIKGRAGEITEGIIIKRDIASKVALIYNSLAVSLIMMIYENNKTELNRLLGFQNIMNDVGYIASAFIICYVRNGSQ